MVEHGSDDEGGRTRRESGGVERKGDRDEQEALRRAMAASMR
jgi:hypothetical protein